MDYTLFIFIHQFQGRSEALDAIALFIAQGLTTVIVAVLLIAVVYFIALKSKNSLIIFLSIIAGGLGKAIEILFEYVGFFPRPFVVLGFQPLFSIPASDSSFPSGHASFLFAIAFFLLLAQQSVIPAQAGIHANGVDSRVRGNDKRGWTTGLCIVLCVLAALVGLARVYAGIHWPLDIVGGAFAGLLSASIVALGFRAVKKKFYGD